MIKEKFEVNRSPALSPAVSQVCVARTAGIAEISGLCVIDSEKKNYARPVGEQTMLILKDLDRILSGLGITKEHVIKCNVFLRKMDDYEEMNQAYTQYFGTENPPARQTVAVGLSDGYDVEISFTAVLQ